MTLALEALFYDLSSRECRTISIGDQPSIRPVASTKNKTVTEFLEGLIGSTHQGSIEEILQVVPDQVCQGGTD